MLLLLRLHELYPIFTILFTCLFARVRPTSGMESTCIVCDPGRAEILVKSRQYTYDYVYDACTEQEELYHDCVEGLITG